MSRFVNIFLVLTTTILGVSGCSGGGGGGAGPGYWFELILIVIPIFALGYLIMNRFDSINDSLFTIENKMNDLKEKIDELEAQNKKKGGKK